MGHGKQEDSQGIFFLKMLFKKIGFELCTTKDNTKWVKIYITEKD